MIHQEDGGIHFDTEPFGGPREGAADDVVDPRRGRHEQTAFEGAVGLVINSPTTINC